MVDIEISNMIELYLNIHVLQNVNPNQRLSKYLLVIYGGPFFFKFSINFIRPTLGHKYSCIPIWRKGIYVCVEPLDVRKECVFVLCRNFRGFY